MSEYAKKVAKAKEPRVAIIRSEEDAHIECFKHDAAYLEVSWASIRFFEDITATFLGYIRSLQYYKTNDGEIDDDGFFLSTIDYAQNGCGLSRATQDRALAVLIKLGLVHKKVVGLPPKRWLKLDVKAYQFFVETYNTLPLTWPVSYKEASVFCGSDVVDITSIVTKYASHLIESSKFQNAGKQQIEMLESNESICENPATDKHRVNEHRVNEHREKGTVTSYRDEGQNPPSSGHSYSANHLAVNQALNATRSNTNTPANSRQRKPRRPPAPLPSHPAIPFMQELARTLAPVLASPAHADYPSEGATAFKYHTDALEAYDAIQTGAIMARTLDRPERYTDLTIWGNDFRLAQLKQWAKDPKAMEAALLSAARIFATSRAKNTTVAKLPSVAAFLFGSTTSGGFLPWWSAIKPVEAMEAKEKQILKEADLEEKSKPRFLELEEKNRIEQNSYMHETFVKLFGREPKQFKETK